MGTVRQLYKMKMPVPVLVVACLLSLAASDPLSVSQNCQHAACNQNNVVGNHAGQQQQPEHGGGQHHQGGGVHIPGGAHVVGVHIPGTHISGAHIPGARIPGVHIPGVHIPGVHIPGTHVPGVHARAPSPHHQPTPQHHQASISQNCEGSHCNQNN